MQPSRTLRDLERQASEDRLRETLNLPARKPVHIRSTPKRTPEETARLVADLEAKLGIKTIETGKNQTSGSQETHQPPK